MEIGVKSSADHLLYRIFDISHSCLKKLPGSACIQEFLQSDINNGLLQLTHDRTSNSPILSLIASNNHTKTLPVKMNVQFVLNSNTLFLQWFIPILASMVVLSLIFMARKIIIGKNPSEYISVPEDPRHLVINDDKFEKSSNANTFHRARLGFFSNFLQSKNDETELETRGFNTSPRRYGTL